MTRKDFIPDSYKNLQDWTANYAAQLGSIATRIPFQDDTPAPASQTMQAREYQAMGVVADTEVGNPSNIASAVFQA